MAQPSAEIAVRFSDVAKSMHRRLLAVVLQQAKPWQMTWLCTAYYKHSAKLYWLTTKDFGWHLTSSA